MTHLELVKEFYTVFEKPFLNRPGVPSSDRVKLSFRIIEEELQEFEEAVEARDIVAIVDAIVDLEYVLLNAVLEFGLGDCWEELFQEVHRSNMTKLSQDGKPIKREDGKILKGPNFTLPDLQSVLRRFQNKDC